MRDLFLRLLLLALGCSVLTPAVPSARAAEEPNAQTETQLERMKRVKDHHYRMIRRKADRRLRRARERAAGVKPLRWAPLSDAEASLAALGVGVRDRPMTSTALPLDGSLVAPNGGFAPHGVGGILPNVRISNTFNEDVGSSQNEPSIAAWGSNVVAAWNDWSSLEALSSLQGYAVSADGGQTFLDRGVLPAPTNLIWTSDPVVAVNDETGEFYYCGLLESNVENDTDPSNGMGVMRGTFVGTTFTWNATTIVRLESNTTHFIDKPWLVVDEQTGALHLSYTEFLGGASRIMYQTSGDRGATWSAPILMHSLAVAGRVQGSRPLVGPNGEVYVIWRELGPFNPGLDFMRLKKSTNGGVSFGPEITVVGAFDNFGTGAPGFNRERGVAFPSISVDHSTGPNRGRLYVVWNESFNWYDDVPAIGTVIPETEPNEFFADPNFFAIGATLTGTFRDDRDFDSFAFTAEQDSSYVFWADTVAGTTYRMRVFCSDSLTRLTYAGVPDELTNLGGNESFMAWTCPASGTYYLDVSNARLAGAAAGTYRIRTGRGRHGAERGRDQRDVFVTSSSDGNAWTAPVLVNDDAPHYDNWLPEIGTARDGSLYVTWYDWRDSPATCAGGSHLYMAKSQSLGATWTTLGAVTDVATQWTQTNSNLIPNQGDYTGLFVNETALYLAWTDGRAHHDARFPGLDIYDPDIFGAVYSLLPESLQVSGVATADVDRVSILWTFREPRVVQARVYRRDAQSQRDLGLVVSDVAGQIAFVDSTVGRGVRYVYSLGVMQDGVERMVGDVFVTVSGIALLASPNPFQTNTAITFDLPEASNVVLAIHDVSGREIRELVHEFRPAGLQAPVFWNGYADEGWRAASGLYFIRLTTDQGTKSRRVTFTR